MKRFLLCLCLTGSLWAQETEELPVILHSGSGKVQDERQIQYSGGSGSDVVRNHQRPRLPPQVLHQAPSIHQGEVLRIYRCQYQGREVYADDENRVKYQNCVKISERRPESASNEPPTSEHAPESCHGVLVFRGQTYAFDAQEPCPIPLHVFQKLRPVEALPENHKKP